MTRPANRNGYGHRGKQSRGRAGIRDVAPTYGKVLNLTFSEKGGGQISVESDAERLVCHALTIDPDVKTFKPQPFTVDLIGQRILRSPEEVSNAKKANRGVPGPKLYTPDFTVLYADAHEPALEVKLEGFEGDSEYQAVLEKASAILNAAGYPLRRLIFPSHPCHPLRLNLPLLKKSMGRPERLSDQQLACLIEICEHNEVQAKVLCSELQISMDLMPILLVSGVLAADVTNHHICGQLMVRAAFGDLSHLQVMQELFK